MNIVAIVKIAVSAVPSVFKRPMLTIKLLKFAAAKNENLTAIKKATSKDEKIALGVALAKDIVEFKKQNPAEFNDAFDALGEIILKIESDKDFRKSILG